MASGLGYHSGLLEGTKTLRQLGQDDRALNLKEAALGLEAESSYSQNLLRQAQSQEILTKLAKEQQTAALLQQAMGANVSTQMGIDGDLGLAQQSVGAGKAILGTDPKLGLELIKQGQEFSKNATQKELQQLQMQKVKVELQADVFSKINGQDDLDQALPELAKYGVAVPDKYKTWSPETKAWIDNRKIASDNYLKKLQIDEAAKGHEIQKVENESKQQYREKQLQLQNQKEERLRNNQKVNTGKVKEQTQKTIEMEVASLAGLSDDFDDLEGGDKVRAARDVFSLATQLLADGKAKNQAEALEKARELVIEGIEEGEYSGASAEGYVSEDTAKAIGDAVKVTSQADFDKLEPGTLFVNPADGKTYKKK